MTLAKRMVVKRTITYREITVAIGILVAMVIAFTLWVKAPAEKITKSRFQSDMSISPTSYPTQITHYLHDLSSTLLPRSR